MANKLFKTSPVVLKVLAWISLGLSVVSATMIVIGGGTPEVPKTMAVLSLVVGILYWYLLVVVSGLITTVLEIKENTKK